jgi:hypothetical protein
VSEEDDVAMWQRAEADATKPYCSCPDAERTYVELEREFVRVSELAEKRLAAREDWKARCLAAQAEGERLGSSRQAWAEEAEYRRREVEFEAHPEWLVGSKNPKPFCACVTDEQAAALVEAGFTRPHCTVHPEGGTQ